MRRFAATVVALAFLALTLLAPRRAAADFTDGLLISAYVAGGVAAVTLIAILLANRDDEPEFLELVQREAEPVGHRDAGRIRVGRDCAAHGPNLPLFCW